MQMQRLGLEREIVDTTPYERAAARFGERGVVLPTFTEIAEPWTAAPAVREALAGVGPDEPDPRNLFRVHWYNDASRRGRVEVPEHVVLPEELTGTPARIVVALADRFPLVACHKVLASYGCLAPRVVAGQFDPSTQRAIWPSTGNYCRGGVAISKLMGCRGVAVLPAGMSRERFDWLAAWAEEPSDIVRTPGTESNVKEIYDECNRLAADPANVVFNQFAELGNHVIHYLATGKAIERIVDSLAGEPAGPAVGRLAAFVSATGSAGTIAAGDYLKERFGSDIVAVEALECPTMLYNGFGEHNIQGIGDKHIPLIHNVMNTDVVIAVSDRATDQLNVLFNTAAGRAYLSERRHVPGEVLAALGSFGLSSICNVVAAIKYARHFRLGPDDVVATVATDGAAMYTSELERTVRARGGGVDELAAAEIFGEHLGAVTDDHLRELDLEERTRIFNLGYYTWVEQQGVGVEEFESRRDQSFWTRTRSIVGEWDEMIREFNARSGAGRDG
ncbi:MAG TPA: pyridoxal-phosphate dependent enzyme [Acidimicrobiales bacterium]|nr:pyridoxal-phosphate dependent enzyme [Acidimicrobiales bacterium]